jgi:hypothetical protein
MAGIRNLLGRLLWWAGHALAGGKRRVRGVAALTAVRSAQRMALNERSCHGVPVRKTLP